MQKQIGDVVKEARKAKRMTQKELANGICTQATVSNLENNNSVPAVRTLLAIGERLKIDFLIYQSISQFQKMDIANYFIKSKNF